MSAVTSDPVTSDRNACKSTDAPTAELVGEPASRAARTERMALQTAYEEFSPAMRRFAVSLLGNTGDAEDLIHDVFIEAWERWDRYDPSRGTLRNWLLLRVRSRAIDRLRARNRQRNALQQPAPEVCESNPLRALQGNRAWRVLDRAPERLRQVVELRFGHDLSVAEVAERMGIPAGTVKSRQSHALQYLRNEVDHASL